MADMKPREKCMSCERPAAAGHVTCSRACSDAACREALEEFDRTMEALRAR